MSKELEFGIYFFIREEEYGFLSNFWRSKQDVEGIIYPSNEHYYQSMKAHNVEVRAWIREAPSAWLAMKAGDSLRNKEISDGWDKEKFMIMKKGLLAKFSQNSDLKRMLLSTGNKSLH